jgi:hypothetical protein
LALFINRYMGWPGYKTIRFYLNFHA